MGRNTEWVRAVSLCHTCTKRPPEGGVEKTGPEEPWKPGASVGRKAKELCVSMEHQRITWPPAGVRASHPDATIVSTRAGELTEGMVVWEPGLSLLERELADQPGGGRTTHGGEA